MKGGIVRGGVVLAAALVAAVAVYMIERRALLAGAADTFQVRATLIERYMALMRHKVYALETEFEHLYARGQRSDFAEHALGSIRHYPEHGVWGVSGLAAEDGVPELSGTLTGTDRLASPSPALRDELGAVFVLDKQFETLLEHVPEIIWVYYTSTREFIYISPDPAIADFRFSDVLYTKPFWVRATPEQNPQGRQIISELYEDAYGQGLMISISSPVEHEGRFVGVMSLDIGIDLLQELTAVGTAAGQSILVDEDDRVVARPGDFDLAERYVIAPGDGWSTGPDGAYWRTQQVVAGELRLLHRLSQGALFVAIARRAAPAWVVIAVMSVLLLTSLRLRRALEQVHGLMRRDTLTHLLNRRGLDNDARALRAEAERRGLQTSLVLFDIDHFKQVNDRHGHAIGDDVLNSLARRLTTGVQENDRVCRWGGEEILVLLVHGDETSPREVAERLRESIAAQPMTRERLWITVSGGLTAWQPGESLETVVGRADALLYEAKRGGRNRIESDIDARAGDDPS